MFQCGFNYLKSFNSIVIVITLQKTSPHFSALVLQPGTVFQNGSYL